MRSTPIAIALDEELIRGFDYTKKARVVSKRSNPNTIIFKPSFVGVLRKSRMDNSCGEK